MTDDLEEMFDFDESELLLNQNEQLSGKQRKLLNEYRQIGQTGGKLAFGALIFTTVFWFVMWSYATQFKFDLNKDPEVSIAFFGVLLIIWLLFLFFYFLGDFRSDLKSGKISSVEGFAKLSQKKLPRGLGTAFYVKIGKVKFQVFTKEQFAAIKPDAQYRVFYIKHPPTQIILSIAKIDGFAL